MAESQFTREKFESRIERIPEAGCWLWLGAIGTHGYGVFYFREGKRIVTAHRASWIIYRGQIPDGLFVLHRCDVRSCVNPHHLFIGNSHDNCLDMAIKGRSTALLSADDVREIKRLRSENKTLKEIGIMYGVTLHCIWRIVQKKNWRHIE